MIALSVNSPPLPPTSNKLFWSLIALAPHSYDYKTGKMQNEENEEQGEMRGMRGLYPPGQSPHNLAL